MFEVRRGPNHDEGGINVDWDNPERSRCGFLDACPLYV